MQIFIENVLTTDSQRTQYISFYRACHFNGSDFKTAFYWKKSVQRDLHIWYIRIYLTESSDIYTNVCECVVSTDLTVYMDVNTNVCKCVVSTDLTEDMAGNTEL